MPKVKLKGGFVTKDKRLDRVPQFDIRSRRFPIRELLPEDKPLRSYTWKRGVQLDQKREGACVGFGLGHELSLKPLSILGITNEFARQIYKEAQKRDEWPGESYEGTSVIAGAKVLVELGYMTAYRWGFTLDDAIRTLGYKGCVVLGITWYEGMMEPDGDGFIHPTGAIVGGHCIVAHIIKLFKIDKTKGWVLSNIDLDKSWIGMQNSWGDRRIWKLTLRDFDRLRREDGEVMIPIGRKRPKVAA